jgi:hypothetical protein
LPLKKKTGAMILGSGSHYFIYVGNAVVFTVLIVPSFKHRYVAVIKEIQALPSLDKKKLTVIANVYMALSMLTLVPFIV